MTTSAVELREQIDRLIDRYLHVSRDERLRLIVEYIQLKEELEEARIRGIDPVAV